MAIPRTVQLQLEAAEAQLAAQQGAPQGPAVIDDPSQLTAAPTAPAPAPAAPAPQSPAPQAPSEPDWKQKFQTVQGMYNKDVPELRGSLKTAESQIVALTTQVQALMQAQRAQQAEPKRQEADPRDVASFGQDMIEMVQRYVQGALADVKAEFGQVINHLDGRMTVVENSVKGVSQKTETTLETQFYATLRQIVPDYEAINATQEWLAWLSEVDPVYRVPRQAAIDSAFSRMDVEGVAAVFQAYKASRPPRPSAALASQVAPGSTGGSTPPAAEETKPVISQKFVNTFYSDQAKGRYRGREAEMNRIENLINTAAAEGRII